MVDERNIRRASEHTNRWLVARQKKHIAMVEKSINDLQDGILNSINKLATNTSGKIEGLAVNMKQAQKIHAEVNKLFYTRFSMKTKALVNDFKSVSKVIEQSYSYLDEAVKFTSIDNQTMNVLRDGYWRDYLAIGDQQKQKVIQSVYNQVIGGGSLNTLTNTIHGALMGSKSLGVTGRSLAQYSRLYAKDMIMNFHNEVNVKKSEDIGIKHFLYVGDIIATSRSFCKQRAGKTYTKDQINSWNHTWPGKSGPPMTHRGGYNCRHHWQGVKKEWLEGKKKIDIADWFKED